MIQLTLDKSRPIPNKAVRDLIRGFHGDDNVMFPVELLQRYVDAVDAFAQYLTVAQSQNRSGESNLAETTSLGLARLHKAMERFE